jgi:sensor histidine kinase YesM
LVGLLLIILLVVLWQKDARNSRYLLEQKEQLEKRERTMRLLQAQTIQSQMNPHFTSNALAAIQRQILTHDAERASDNLVKMGRLTRAYLEDSLLREDDPMLMNRDISLTREVTLLKMYVELMQLQYENRFDFVLDIQSSLNTDDYRLPPFLIQPFIENAIVHGLHHLTTKGNLRVQFLGLPHEVLLCQIEDDGIGREASRRILNLDPKENYGQVYIRTDDIDTLYQSLLDNNVSIHPNAPLQTKPWGQKEFALLDPDNNLLTFGQDI